MLHPEVERDVARLIQSSAYHAVIGEVEKAVKVYEKQVLEAVTEPAILEAVRYSRIANKMLNILKTAPETFSEIVHARGEHEDFI